jgi:hypothetical protein
MLQARLSTNFRQNLVGPLEPVLLRTFLAICDEGSFTASRPILAAGT